MENTGKPEVASSIERMSGAMEVINFALKKVEQKYGTGFGDGESPKAYHNLLHTKNVLESAGKIAALALKNGKIIEGDIDLAQIAASFHDIEQDLGGGANEEESVRLSQEEMNKTEAFELSDKEKVKKMILATIVSFENGVLKQSATDDYLTRIITDADLSALGQPPETYWATAQSLLKEMKKTDTPSYEDQLLWAQGQIAYLSNHQFYTDEARELFPHKEANIEFAKQQIKILEGEIKQN